MSALRPPVAVLCSGGLDSAVLLVDVARTAGSAVPVFVRAGHVWEEAERAALARFTAAVADARIAPIHDLTVPMADVYGAHWSITGRDPPGWDAPDEEVELPGRNLILLAKALVLAARHDWPTVALGSLAGNPFPDATSTFFAALAGAASDALRTPLAVVAPYHERSKADVIRLGAGLPLGLTLSCLRPTPAGEHCGDCNKCRERADAFAVARVPDPTRYVRGR